MDAPLLALPPLVKNVTGAYEFVTHSKVQLDQTRDGVVLHLPPASKGQLDRVIVLTTEEAK